MSAASDVGIAITGNVYMSVMNDDGEWEEYVDTGGGDKFESKSDAEIKTQSDFSPDNYGQAIDGFTVPKNTTFSMSFNRPNRAVLAAQLLGSYEEVTQAATPVTGETHVAGAVGTVTFLAKHNLDPSVPITVSNSGALTEGTDYTVDYRAGAVKWLTDQEGDTITFGYTPKAFSGVHITAGTKSQFKVRFKFAGINLVNKKFVFAWVHEAQITPTNAFQMIAKEHSKVEFSGTLTKPADKLGPVEVVIAQ